MLNFKKRKWIVHQKNIGNLTDSEIASAQKISRRAVQKIYSNYKLNGLESLQNKPKGRKPTETPEIILKEIIKLRKEGYGIRRISGLLEQKNLHVPIKRVHNELKKLNLVIPEPKKGKRYNYISWEREHSNSLWQTDFCWVEPLECWLTAWLDDHSRFVTIAEYVTEATTDESLRLFEKACKKYGYPRETLSDRGAQYYAMRGETSRFLEHMNSKGVHHIYSSVKKPTTCGKLERFWGTHNRERWEFSSLQRFLNYYNHKRPHMSLGYKTPYEIYVKDIR